MRRYILFFIFLLLSLPIMAQNLWVYSTNGNVEVFSNAAWAPIMSHHKIALSDSLKMGDCASATILDRKNDKLYAIQATGTHCVRDLIKNSNGAAKTHPKGVISFLWNSLRGNNDIEDFRHAAGVVYRDDDINRRLARAIRCNSSHIPVSFDILESDSLCPIVDSIEVGKTTIFRVSNQSQYDIFVNIIDIDAAGRVSSCIPVSPIQQMTQLLMPSGSVVVLDKFPIRFSEPKGPDMLILIASLEVFDVNSVIEHIGEESIISDFSEIGFYKLTVNVK